MLLLQKFTSGEDGTVNNNVLLKWAAEYLLMPAIGEKRMFRD